MFIIKLYRYLCGYVLFSISGGFSERFLNLVSQNAISLWDTTRKGDKIYSYTLAKDYKKMRTLAKKTKVTLKVEGKMGYKFKTNKYKKRKGFLLGAFLLAVLFYIMSNLVWTVKVNGNQTVESRLIIETLQEEGFKPGCFTKTINVSEVEQKALLRLPQLSWLAINIKGGNATIEVKERVVVPSVEQPSDQKELVASRRAVISRFNIYSGTAAVERGDVVSKGTVLINGYYVGKMEEKIEQEAKGEVYGYTTRTKSFYVAYKGYEEKVEKEQNNYIYESLGFKIPFMKVKQIPNDSKVNITSENVKFFGWELPILKHTQNIQTINLEEKTYSEDEVNQQLDEKQKKYEEELPGTTKILKRKVETKKTKEGIKRTVTYEMEEQIAKAP